MFKYCIKSDSAGRTQYLGSGKEERLKKLCPNRHITPQHSLTKSCPVQGFVITVSCILCLQKTKHRRLVLSLVYVDDGSISLVQFYFLCFCIWEHIIMSIRVRFWGGSENGFVISDRSDLAASKEPTNPLWTRIHWFL